jgi:hypothetical protein
MRETGMTIRKAFLPTIEWLLARPAFWRTAKWKVCRPAA